jgi:TolA-binding protein
MNKLFILFIFLSLGYSVELRDLEKKDYNYLTQTEKYILKNIKSIKSLNSHNIVIKSEIQKLYKQIENQDLILQKNKLSISTLSSRLDGIESIFPSFDKTSTNLIHLKKDVQDLNKSLIEENYILKEKIVTLEANIKKLENSLLESNNIIKNNYTTMSNIIEKIAHEIDDLKKENIKLRDSIKKNSDFKSQSKSKIFDSAKKLYEDKKYDKSYEMFNYLLESGYKRATSSFYLGEIYYYKQADYSTALKFYKKSIEFYPKPASFTDKLLYHTGYSFEKLGSDKAAISSYKKLMRDYPNSYLVEYAKKRITKLTEK